MSESLRVLLVEDSDDDAALTLRELQTAGFEVVYDCVDDAASMENALGHGTWDVVISDWSLPRFNAPAAIRLLHGAGRRTPFFIVTGSTKDDLSAELGATGFFEKGRLAGLAGAIRAALGR